MLFNLDGSVAPTNQLRPTRSTSSTADYSEKGDGTSSGLRFGRYWQHRMASMKMQERQQQQQQQQQQEKAEHTNSARGGKRVKLDYWTFDRYRSRQLAKAYEQGRQECLVFCAKVQTALPRELRDMVYDRLMQTHIPGTRMQHHVFDPVNYSSNPLVAVSFFAPRSRIPEQVSARRDVWKYAEYTGATVAREIAERWYANGTFMLDPADKVMDKFLSTDVWEQGVIPADVVRSVRIDIRPEYLDGPGANAMSASQIMSEMAKVAMLGNKKAEILFNLTAEFYERKEYRLLFWVMDRLRPTTCLLREKGFTKVTVRQTVSPRCPNDITPIFGEEAEGFFLLPPRPVKYRDITTNSEVFDEQEDFQEQKRFEALLLLYYGKAGGDVNVNWFLDQ